jgi:hypothetical protein
MEKQMNNSSDWGTSTLGLAAAVKALGAEFTKVDKTDSRRMVFYFAIPKDTYDLEKYFGNLKFDFSAVEIQWTNGNLQVNARRYFEALQDLKSVIHTR